MTNQNTSKIILKLYFLTFHLTNILLGLDLGYTKCNSRTIKYLMKIYRFIQTCIVLFLLFFYSGILVDQEILMILWYINVNILFLSCTLISQFSSEKYSLYTFEKNLMSIDKQLNVPRSVYNIELKFVKFWSLVIIYETCINIYFCNFFLTYCNIPVHFVFFFNCPIYLADVLLVVFAFLFYSVFCRMKSLTNMVSNCSTNYNICIEIYRKLAEVTDEGKCNAGYMFFWALTFYVLDTMIAVFFPLAHHDSKQTASDYISANLTVIPSLILIFAPAYTASMLSSQVQTLRMLLYDRLIRDRDKDHYIDLKKFISYIEARPFQFTVAGVLPLDWSLVAMVLNVIITYVIVLLQLTRNT